MKLWLFTRKDEHDIGYDEYLGFVVRAETRKQAISFTNKQLSKGISKDFYKKKFRVSKLKEDGIPGILLESYFAG